MIRRIHVKNFRSLKDTTVEFKSPLTIIVGPNNTGKSAFLNCIGLMAILVMRPLNEVFSGRNAFLFVHSSNSHESDPIEISIEIDNIKNPAGSENFKYRISLGKNLTGRVMVIEEELVRASSTGVTVLLRRSRNEDKWTFFNERTNSIEPLNANPDQLGVMLLPDIESHKGVLEFRMSMSSLHQFDLQPQSMKMATPITPSPVLYFDGSNIATVLDSMNSENQGQFANFKRELQRVIPEVKEVRFKSVEGGSKILAFLDAFSPQDFVSFQASDGMLRTVGLLAALNSQNQPTVMTIEEPENGIHPRRLAEFVELFRRYAKDSPGGVRRQVIANTHSPYVVNCVELEELLIAHRDKDGTQFSTVDDRGRIETLMEDAPLGELWYRGSIGGVPLP